MDEQARQCREQARQYGEQMDEQAKQHREQMDKMKDKIKKLIQAVHDGARGSSTVMTTLQLLMPQSVGQWNQDHAINLENQFANATGVCINQNIVIDFVHKV